MAVYLFIIYLLCYLMYKYDIKGAYLYRQRYERLVILILILVVGLRYHIGSDTVVYEWNFNTSYTPNLYTFFSDWKNVTQPLWVLVMSFCKTVFGSFVFVQFFHAIVFNILTFRYIKNTTRQTFAALLLLFTYNWFALNFEVLRESICVALFLNALIFYKEKRFIPYWLFAFISLGFHVFSIIPFLIVPLANIFRTKTLVILFFISLVLARIVPAENINYLLLTFQGLLGDSTSAGKLSMYIGQDNLTVISFFGLVRSLLLGYFLPLSIVCFSDEKYAFEKKIVLLNLIIGAFVIKIPILYRFGNYFAIVYVVLIVNTLYKNKKLANHPSLFLFIKLLAICFVLMNMYDIYRPERTFDPRPNVTYDCRYFPYKTIFQDPDPIREAIRYYH